MDRDRERRGEENGVDFYGRVGKGGGVETWKVEGDDTWKVFNDATFNHFIP